MKLLFLPAIVALAIAPAPLLVATAMLSLLAVAVLLSPRACYWVAANLAAWGDYVRWARAAHGVRRENARCYSRQMENREVTSGE